MLIPLNLQQAASTILWLASEITSLRTFGPPLTPQRDQPRLLTWLVAGL
jgi:hypothetical protein